MNDYEAKSAYANHTSGAGLSPNATIANSAQGQRLVGSGTDRTPTAMDTIEGRLLTGLDQLHMVSARVSHVIERLGGPRPEEAGNKVMPPSPPGTLGRIDRLFEDSQGVINRIAADLAIFERFA